MNYSIFHRQLMKRIEKDKESLYNTTRDSYFLYFAYCFKMLNEILELSNEPKADAQYYINEILIGNEELKEIYDLVDADLPIVNEDELKEIEKELNQTKVNFGTINDQTVHDSEHTHSLEEEENEIDLNNLPGTIKKYYN